MNCLLLLIFISLIIPVTAQSEVNLESHDISVEYGLAYHVLEGTQKSNKSKGRLTSAQYPFWNASYTYRFSKSWAVRFFAGVHFVRFDEPQQTSATIKSENQVLRSSGLEFSTKTGPYSKWGFFGMQQNHPLYFTKAPQVFEVVNKDFYQAGVSLTLSQRRRIGLIWGLGAKAYTIFPSAGGNIVTETGYGGEGFARLGFIGPLGTSYQAKAFYQITSAPNAAVTFNHEMIGYCLQVNLSF